MAKVSRRALIAAGMALPVVIPDNAAPQSLTAKHPPVDALIACAEEWIALRERVDALSAEADDLQGLVFDKGKRIGMNGNEACNSSLPEACAWREKQCEFEEGEKSLAKLARKLRRMRATTIAGAIAKIELSLHAQYEDWSEHAFEFVEDGIAELRLLTGGKVGRRHDL